MLSPNTEVASKAATPIAPKTKNKARPANLDPKIPWCDHCGKRYHTREKCYRIHGFPNPRTTNENKEPSMQKANTAELTQQLSTEDIQALKRLLPTGSTPS